MVKLSKKEIASKIESLEMEVQLTLSAMDGRDEVLDLIFKEQAEKIKKEIKDLRKTRS